MNTVADHDSSDPAAAAERVRAIIMGPAPAFGCRHDALVELAFRAAEAGMSNDAILLQLDIAAECWEKYPGLYVRWTKLLSLLRLARGVYPNSPQGHGWRPGVGLGHE